MNNRNSTRQWNYYYIRRKISIMIAVAAKPENEQSNCEVSTSSDYRFYLLPKIVSSFDCLKHFVSYSINDMYNHFFSRHRSCIWLDYMHIAHTHTQDEIKKQKVSNNAIVQSNQNWIVFGIGEEEEKIKWKWHVGIWLMLVQTMLSLSKAKRT